MEPLKNTARRFFSSSSNQAKYALEVHKAIKEIRKNFEAITRDIRSFPLLGNEPISRSERALTADRARTCIVDASEIIGRDRDKDEVVKLLLKPSVDESKISVVSVVGMGGMGKTTVAQLVYDDKSWQKKCQFDNNRFWVSDSKQYDLESLLKHILKSIDPKDTSLDKLGEDHLSNRFVDKIQGKSFLLVLDDVDCEDRSNWENLMKLLKKGNKEKSRVLVTTRSRKVAEVVGSLSSDSTHHLGRLSQEDSKELFERHASTKRRDAIFNEIVEKCCGVPLALKVIGSLLRGANAVEWENVRKGKSLADIVDEPYERNKLIHILKISYDDLDPTTKQCFSFCALFPKNYIIPKEILSSIWMANIHFEINKSETLEDVCGKKLRILYNRCFLEAENMKDVPFDGFEEATHFKMHDLIYDLARDVAGEEIVVVGADLEGDKFIVEEKVRHLFLAQKTTGTLQLKRKERLRSILTYPGEREMLLSVLSEFPALRMLDICSCRNDNLPRSVGRLIHLRYLCLFDNDFQTLPDSICELINLKHLRLCDCRALTQMPSRMGALASLQVLYIDYCHKLEELPSSIVNLVNLRQLFLKSCHSLRNLPFRMDALTSLRLLDIYHCLHLEQQSCIGNMVNLRHLSIYSYKGSLLPFEVGALTSLELLSLDCRNQIELPRGIQKLNNLRKLSLQFGECLARMPSGMGALLSICHPALFVVGDPDSSYAQLEELLPLSNFPADLMIRICKNYKLKTPIGDGEPFLSNKKSLRKLDIMFEHHGNDYMIQSEIDGWNETEEVLCHRDILEKLEPPPNLEKFELCGYKCMTFPPWVRQHDFASGLENLVELFLKDCNQVRYLPFMRTLKSLERLGLHELDNLEYIEENISATVFCLPRLKSLSLMDLQKFRGWCGGLPDGVNEDDSELIQLMRPPSFPCLSDVDIEYCSTFQEPFHLLLSLNISNFKNGSRFVAEIDGGVSYLCLQKTDDSLKLSIDAHRVTPRYMVETFRAMSGHLAFLHLSVNSEFKTLPGLQHLTALRVLEIDSCYDFTWEEEEEEEMQSVRDDEIQSTSLHTAHHRHVSWTGLTSLESLTLEHLPRMVRLPEGIQFLPSLKKLDICYCENLQIPEWLQETFECREDVKMWSKHFLWVKKETDAAAPPLPL